MQIFVNAAEVTEHLGISISPKLESIQQASLAKSSENCKFECDFNTYETHCSYISRKLGPRQLPSLTKSSSQYLIVL